MNLLMKCNVGVKWSTVIPVLQKADNELLNLKLWENMQLINKKYFSLKSTTTVLNIFKYTTLFMELN